jgi:hypothetical protein
MSQDLRTYDLRRVDRADNEASSMSVTATVGPKPDDSEATRGVQITLRTPNGTAYGRVTEGQIRDLIGVLNMRVNPEMPYEATGWKATDVSVKPDGRVAEEVHSR